VFCFLPANLWGQKNPLHILACYAPALIKHDLPLQRPSTYDDPPIKRNPSYRAEAMKLLQ
jgi:hypothetical protein